MSLYRVKSVARAAGDKPIRTADKAVASPRSSLLILRRDPLSFLRRVLQRLSLPDFVGLTTNAQLIFFLFARTAKPAMRREVCARVCFGHFPPATADT